MTSSPPPTPGPARATRVAALVVPLVLLGLTVAAAPAQATRPGCTVSPPQAYADAADPGAALRPVTWSAHRGSVNLGPQQTLQARLGAIAYGSTMIEVDVRKTADGVLVAAHDTNPDSVDFGRRDVTALTAAQYTAQNAAIGPWTGTEFDPAYYQTLDEVIALAERYHVGLDIEFKDLGADRGGIRATAVKIAQAGVMDLTLWQHGVVDDVIAQVSSVDPAARFNYNVGGPETPEFLYAEAAATEYSFGSSLAKFTAPVLAALHDGCALALPHSYDGISDVDLSPAANEAERLVMVAALARGVDGFQTNRPDAAAAAAGQPVPSRLERTDGSVCLVEDRRGLPLVNRTLLVDGIPQTAGKGGCVPALGATLVSFDGDGSALAAAPLAADAPTPVVPELPLALLAPLTALGLLALRLHRKAVR